MDLGENPHTNIWKINVWEARVCLRTSPRLHFAEKNNANQTISNTQINGNFNRVPLYTPGWRWLSPRKDPDARQSPDKGERTQLGGH